MIYDTLFYQASEKNITTSSDCQDKTLIQVLKEYDVFSDPFLQNKVGTLLYTGIPKLNYDTNYDYFGTSFLQLNDGSSCQWTTCTKIPRNDSYIVTYSDPLLYNGTNDLNQPIQIQISYFPDFHRRLKISSCQC